MFARIALAGVLIGLLSNPLAADDAKDLVGHWRLLGSVADSGPLGLNAENHGADVKATGRDGKPATAFGFDGRGAHLEVPHRPALNLGKGDFTIALWVHTDKNLADDLGDLVSLYSPSQRKGFSLSLRCNTGVTHSQANYRQLQFSIDNGTTPNWRDEGRPGKAIYGMAMAVHDGGLYVGTCEAGKEEAGRIYRYDGPVKWSDCGSPDRANAISALATFEGKLYAGSAKYRLGGSSLKESENLNLGGRIYRYEGGDKWVEVGQLPDTEAVGGMVVYRGRLYASSLYRPAGFFRYEGGKKWTARTTPNDKRVEALTVFNGYLWATGYDEGHVYRYDGETWTDLGQVGEKDNTQTYAFAVYEGKLCVATWRSGKVFRWLEKTKSWQDMGRLGEELEVMGMLVHNGKLYAGTLPSGDVYRFDGGTTWQKVGALDTTPNVRYRRVWTMAQYQGRLFATTLPSGHVHSMTAGVSVTWDREFLAGWHHVTAARAGDRLRLYVDGKAVAESAAFDPATYDLSVTQPLRIGAGSGDFFHGKLADVRLYRRALIPGEIARIAESR